MTMRRSRLSALSASLAGILLAGCSRFGTEAHVPVQEEQAPPRATVISPQRKDLLREIELPGRVEAYEETPLYAKATGYVLKIPVDIGDRIQGPQGDQPGTLLCELQVPELNQELAQKTAAIAQARAEVLQSEASIQVAAAAMRTARARILEARAAVDRDESLYTRWNSEFQRVAQLAESGAVTRKVADETRAQLDAADAGRKETAARIAAVEAQQKEASAALKKSRADAAAARARLTVAEADERRTAAMLEYTRISAPFDGIVVQRNVHTGHLVQAGVGTGLPLLRVMKTDPVRIIIDVPETDARHLSEQTRLEVRLPSNPGITHAGTLSRSSWSLNESSRTMAVEFHIPNPKGDWRPGQYVQARLTAAEIPAALSLPKSAVFVHEKQTYCCTVDVDGLVRRLPVSLGIQAGNDVEIREGLTGTEQVISLNASAFRDGQRVEAVPPAK